MTEILTRKEGRAGRITLNRPAALNALTHGMAQAIEAALDEWRDDPEVALVVIDATGDRAFCAGGDIAQIYHEGLAGVVEPARDFWRDEYRMNAKLFEFPKPVASLLQGFVMGGGVGVGCHGSHRIVGESSQIAMPECGIGLVPDVGGSLILARAPGRLGEYLGLTGDRMGPADAIHAGFADYFIPEADWPELIETLCATGDWEAIDRAARTPPEGRLARWQPDIDATFGGERLGDIMRALPGHPSEATAHAEKLMSRNSPLSMACAVELIHRVRARDQIRHALEQEFRFTYRAIPESDFLEGIRAAVIDKDRSPKWMHASWRDVTGADVLKFTMPLGPTEGLTFDKE